MDKYVRAERKKEEAEIKENEIRITSQGKMANYITYALGVLQSDEKPVNEVVLKAMGQAINRTINVAEIIKRRVSGLHQLTELDSAEITDVWEPIEEGLKTVTIKRRVSSITIRLSKIQLDTSKPGYQAPIPEGNVQANPRFNGNRGRRGRWNRGGRGGAVRDVRDTHAPMDRGGRGGYRGRGYGGGNRGGSRGAANTQTGGRARGGGRRRPRGGRQQQQN